MKYSTYGTICLTMRGKWKDMLELVAGLEEMQKASRHESVVIRGADAGELKPLLVSKVVQEQKVAQSIQESVLAKGIPYP